MNDAEASSSREAAIDALCSRHALAALPAVALGTTIAGLTVALVLSAEVPWSRLGPWVTGLFVIATARLVLSRVLGARPRADAEVRSFLVVYATIGGFAALWWGVGLLVAARFSTSPLVLMTVLLAVVGQVAGGAISTAGTPRTMVTVFAASLTPPTSLLVFSGESSMRPVAAMVVGLFVACLGILRQNYRALRESFRLRLENQELLASLAVEKEREEAARRDAERANQDKSRFLAAASHDARQPLHALGLFVDALKAQPLDPRASQLVANIDLAQSSLVSLHEGLLELSAADVGAVVPRPRSIALREVLRIVETESAPRARQRGLRLTSAGPDLTVLSDPDLLLRIVRNLVANALTYTERGRVLIAVRRRAGRAVLQVWDTGVGIAADEQARIFDELYQVGNPERARGGGLGLGLAIVRRLARAMRTDVTVRSSPGRGSVFSLALPLAATPLVGAVPATQHAPRGEVVLLVDDDGLTRAALSAMLETWGYEVVVAQSAEEALEYAAQLEQLDVVLTDLWLPGRSGFELLADLTRTRPRLRRVVVSGDTAPDTAARAQVLGADFVRKPVRTSALQQLLFGVAEAA